MFTYYFNIEKQSFLRTQNATKIEWVLDTVNRCCIPVLNIISSQYSRRSMIRTEHCVDNS